MGQLEELLQQCIVKLLHPNQMGWGTGFFASPELILTCAHVVQMKQGQLIEVCWQNRKFESVVELLLPDPFDIALLRVAIPLDVNPACVYLDTEVRSRDPLYLFGYPDHDFPNGCPATFDCEGFTGDIPALIKFALGQVRPGMSGSPLLNQRTGKVCGIVKFTRDRTTNLGGGAVPVQIVLDQFPQLKKLQKNFHYIDRRWIDLIEKKPKINFRPYLNSLVTTYGRWWKLYTPTDAIDQQGETKELPSFLDFSLLVENKSEKERVEHEQGKGDTELVERLPVLEGIRKYINKHVWLTGRPGSGKTTALVRLLLEEATIRQRRIPISVDEEVTTQQERIPVLVELRYWQGDIVQLVLNAFNRHGLSLEVSDLKTALSQSLILFDGVNELPSEEARSQLSAFRLDYLRVPMVFTTRDLNLNGDMWIEQVLEIQPLTESQMQVFIRAYVPERAEEMLKQFHNRLKDLGQTPLLLWMLCELFQQTREIPENLGLVFRLFTQGYERKLKQDVVIESNRGWWKPVLQQLAWVMMHGKKPTEFRVAIGRNEALKAITQFLDGKVPYAEDFAKKCLLDLQKHHLIQSGVNNEELEFRHQLIQEYYAAEFLLEQLPTLSDEMLRHEYLNYLKWTEPVALMLALIECESQALRVVKLSLGIDWILGARLAGEAKPKWQQQTVEMISDLKVPDWLKLDLYARTRSNFAIPKILEVLQKIHLSINRFGVANDAVRVLSQFGFEAIRSTLKTLNYKDYSVRQMVVKLLRELCKRSDEGQISISGRSNLDKSKWSKESDLPDILAHINDEKDGFYAFRALVTIQESCKYYNYEIWQVAVKK